MSSSYFNKNNNKKVSDQDKNIFETVINIPGQIVKNATTELVRIAFPDLIPDKANKERKKGNNNFSDLNVKKLQEAYKKKDEDEIKRLQNLINPQEAKTQEATQLETSYFQRNRNEQEEYYLRKKREEEEKKRNEEIEEKQRKQQEADEREKMRQQETPMGKIKKSIFGGGKKKANTNLPVERRAESGKK